MRRISALLACLLVPLALSCDRPVPVAPEGATLTITANPSKIQIDGSSQVTILARKLDGTPVNGGTEITLSTNLGEIPALVETDPGGVALATLTGDGRVGTATVQAFSGAAGEAMIDVSIGGLASFLELVAQPQVVPRDGGDVTITATVFDGDAAPLVGAFITFNPEIGTFSSGGESLVTDNRGQASDVLTVTREQMATLIDPFFIVTATTGGGSEGGAIPVEEIVEIDIAGNPARIVFAATPTTILQTGGTVNLLVTVFDGNSDVLEDIAVNFLTTQGSLDSGGSVKRTDPNGEARDTLVATESDLTAFGGTSFTVSVEVGGLGGLVLADSATIQVQTGIPRASFSADPVAEQCFTYTFTSTSTGEALLTCDWDLDNGAVTHTGCLAFNNEFNQGGTAQRNVSLTVSNSLGSDTVTGSVTVPHTTGDLCR